MWLLTEILEFSICLGWWIGILFDGAICFTVVGVAGDTVPDASGGTATLDLTLTEPDSLKVAGTATGTSLPGGADGAIALNVAGGTPPYTYAWSNGATEPDLMDLPVGIYTVLVTDANSCVREASFEVAPITATHGPADARYRVVVYPNPSTGVFEIRAHGVVAPVAAEVFSVSGQRLGAVACDGLVDLSAFGRGGYLLRLGYLDGGVAWCWVVVL